MMNRESIQKTANEIKAEPVFRPAAAKTELIAALDSADDLDTLLQSQADALVIGIQGFSSQTRAQIQPEQIKETADHVHAHGKKLYVNVQALLRQSMLSEAQALLQTIIESKADGFYAADDGWLELAAEADCLSLLIWKPETLNASGAEAAFFGSLGVQAISLSHELSLREVGQCAEDCSILEVQIGGYTNWMESQRPLLSNYLSFIESPHPFHPGSIYWLQEQTRQERMPVYQDEQGTHVMSSEPLVSDGVLNVLQSGGICRMRIDGFLKGNTWLAKQIDHARHILEKQAGQGEESQLESSKVWQEESILRKLKG